jgi:hypothetical protein
VLDSAKLQPALDKAIKALETRRGQTVGSLPVPFTIAEITPRADGSPFPLGSYLENEVDYIASEIKVAVMYGAFEMRAMVRRFVAANPSIPAAQLFSELDAVQTPAFLRGVPLLNAATNITDDHLKPTYSAVFSPTPNAAGLIDFKSDYRKSLQDMIVPSDNNAAMACIHGLGYSYLNGALRAGGFFDGTNGIWVASDYQFGKVWPPVRAVMSANDGPGTLTGTARLVARLVTLIRTRTLVDSGSSAEMEALLQKASQGVDTPWTARDGRIPKTRFLCNKLGLGPKGSGPQEFRSEVSVIKDVAKKDRIYVVAWQNLLQLAPYGLGDMTSIIVETVREYEK